MLNFYWNAVLKDGRHIPQYPNEAEEISFGIVQEHDKAQHLKRLELICQEDLLAHLSVNLETGEFQIRGAIFHPYNALMNHNDKLHYRVIFYNRRREIKGTGGNIIQPAWTHRFLLGWQVTYEGLNYQKIMYYDPQSGGIDIKGKR